MEKINQVTIDHVVETFGSVGEFMKLRLRTPQREHDKRVYSLTSKFKKDPNLTKSEKILIALLLYHKNVLKMEIKWKELVNIE